MIGTINCVYETPCGWCSKWDKKCDRKMPEKNNSSIEDDINKSKTEATLACTCEYDHDWECYSLSSGGDEYRCRKCGARKTLPLSYQVSTTI